MADTQPCILYYDHRSICSSMVRYTLANATSTSKGLLPLSFELHPIDIVKGEQLSEQYLCEINRKGQVPVLLSPGFLDRPITDSLEITLWLCERYPELRPAEHAEEIENLLRKLHAINFFSISMRDCPQRASMQEQAIQAQMNVPGLSDRHKKALEYKLGVNRAEKVDGVKPEVIQAEIERTGALLLEIDNTRNANNTTNMEDAWVFGTAAPTALDTTLMCLVARMMDVDLADVVPAALLQLTQKWRNTPQFKDIWTSL
ncbi:hypothetical protein A1O7_04523 [Cladophialophora yegresii CBS 114405]|uniref:GST N-terminal domain-containing protein n=1 Tax=Cladophialophora yegresii CBS 114405 TaxID=1182544 RepID=W9W772_9EURO|nr:uncharacterized protein A1O7_04523 [Cladophialophora yegresii CBS 114405]EXJ60371.1 hypothetical protein A1O7_04523 [Cladophialophora yegresii CBS 114405]